MIFKTDRSDLSPPDATRAQQMDRLFERLTQTLKHRSGWPAR
ncbi:hypothetical protein PG5_38820 [Pseudomonas sp. G5(2012)]|nr:hypothetical protein PG5_38820 [Pseudomonas sp. G5(2012)]